MADLEPKYEELQSIYDISNEFVELFLGRTMGYTCGYYPSADTRAPTGPRRWRSVEKRPSRWHRSRWMTRDGYTSVHQYTFQK